MKLLIKKTFYNLMASYEYKTNVHILFSQEKTIICPI